MLEKKRRISKSSFQRLGSGRNFFTPLLTLRVSGAANSSSQASVVVSKKIAKSAVTRSRIRRQVYAALGPLVPRSKSGFLFIIYPKKEVVGASFRAISSDLEKAFTEADVFF